MQSVLGTVLAFNAIKTEVGVTPDNSIDCNFTDEQVADFFTGYFTMFPSDDFKSEVHTCMGTPSDQFKTDLCANINLFV